jgi:hypothetical protein
MAAALSGGRPPMTAPEALVEATNLLYDQTRA